MNTEYLLVELLVHPLFSLVQLVDLVVIEEVVDLLQDDLAARPLLLQTTWEVRTALYRNLLRVPELTHV